MLILSGKEPKEKEKDPCLKKTLHFKLLSNGDLFNYYK